MGIALNANYVSKAHHTETLYYYFILFGLIFLKLTFVYVPKIIDMHQNA